MSDRKPQPRWYDESLPDQMNDYEDADIQIARHRLRNTAEGYRSSIDRSAPVKLQAWNEGELEADIDGWQRSVDDPTIAEDERMRRYAQTEALRRIRDRIRSTP